MPLTAALDAAGLVGQFQRQALHAQPRAIAGMASHHDVERGHGQSPLIPAPGQCVGQRQAHRDRRVQAGRVDVGATRQPGRRQAAAQAGQVQVLRAGCQGCHRPGRKRPQAGVGAQCGATGLGAGQLGFQGQLVERAAQVPLRTPRGRRALLRTQLAHYLELERRVCAQRGLALQLDAVAGHGQLPDAVLAALLGTELDARRHARHGGLAVDVQRIDAQVVQRQRNRQAQARWQRERRRPGRRLRRGADVDALDARRDQGQANPGALEGPPLPMCVLPAQAVDAQLALAQRGLDTRRRERAAQQATGEPGDADARQLAQQPGIAALAAEQPRHACPQQPDEHGQADQQLAPQAPRRARRGAWCVPVRRHQNTTPTDR